MRLFVALDLPEPPRTELAALPLDEAVWRRVPAASLHLTLAFLGERPDPAPVADALPPVVAPVPLRLGRSLVLGRALAVAVEDVAGALEELQAQVAEAAHARERRAFRPHVTVARLRSGASRARRIADAPAPLAFAGGPVTLYESRLGHGPAAYSALWSSVAPT